MNPFEVVEEEVHEDEEGGDDGKPSKPCTGWSHRTVIVIVIYVSLLLDNVLLTVIGECVCVRACVECLNWVD